MKRLKLALLTTFVALLAGSYYYHSQLNQRLNVLDGYVYEVRAGIGLTELSKDLADRNIIQVPAFLLQYYGKLTQYQGEIQAGEYALSDTLDILALLQLLRSGQVIQHQITFAEGWVSARWLAHLRSHKLIEPSPDSELWQKVLPKAVSLDNTEGIFFPDTYYYIKGATDYAILLRAKVRMQQMLTTAWQSRTEAAIVRTQEETLVLASIIEKETGHEPDKYSVSSVFNNRLRRGMKLQSDPTVIFGLNHFDGDLKQQHLKLDHPYNTYIHQGLPPGPICHPGLVSLQAALQPLASPYLYFVAKGDGQSHFSVTLDEHNAAVNRYQKAANGKNNQSRPH